MESIGVEIPCATTFSGDEGLERPRGKVSGHQSEESGRGRRLQTLDDCEVPGDGRRSGGERRGREASAQRYAPAASTSAYYRPLERAPRRVMHLTQSAREFSAFRLPSSSFWFFLYFITFIFNTFHSFLFSTLVHDCARAGLIIHLISASFRRPWSRETRKQCPVTRRHLMKRHPT